MIAVRSERPGDEDAIRRVNELAFEDSSEADLVDALRGGAAWLPDLSLVAETPYDVPPESWMALPLPRYEGGLHGVVRYPPAFDGL